MAGRKAQIEWEAFKHFLKDFGSFAEKPPEFYKLFGRYLTFGVLWGYGKNILKALPLVLQQEGNQAMVWYVHTGGGDFGKGLETSLNNFVSFSAHTASSMSTGHGGGFSGGGGGGGGGGGAG